MKDVSRGISLRDTEAVLLALEGVEPGRSYGYPAYLLGGKFFARFRDDGTVLVLQLSSVGDRDVLTSLDPRAFFFTEHYRNSPAVLVRLADVSPALLADVVAEAWQSVGQRRAVKAAKTAPRRPSRRSPRRSTRPPPD